MDYRAWFESRGLRTLDYQLDILENKLPQSLVENDKPTVLAACPSAGKTLMSIAFLEGYLKANPKYRVLVLTHGTTVLRSQYHEELRNSKPDFSFCNVEIGKDIKVTDAQVVVTLPQTLHRVRNLPKFELLVVDEAHQFYFADMVKSIIKRVEPKKQILLTGTPSPYIYRDYPIIPVTVNTLLKYSMIEDLLVELASSTYDFKNKDYTEFFELKDKVEFRENDTKTTLDQLLKQVESRLTSVVKNNSKLYAGMKNLTGWSASFKALRKTMFACKSQAQAKQVQAYFLEKGIDVALSISDTDVDSDEIVRYKNDTQCPILIVVGRGLLGFNFPELESVIDMTCSHNIDRIFQLLCRVIRKHPQGKKKLFFKVVPHHLEEYFRHVMTSVLCLSDEQYYTTYNGKNFLRLKIPVVKRERSGSTKGWKRTSKKRLEEIKPIEFLGRPAFSLMHDILHKTHGPLNPYAYTTMQGVRNLLVLDKLRDHWTKELCIESAAKHVTRVEWKCADPKAYGSAQYHGWVQECCQHMGEVFRWTKALCLESSAKHNSQRAWRNAEESALMVARKNGWLEECCKHMKIQHNPNGYWTKERCKESALNYTIQAKWGTGDSKAFSAASYHGWVDDCCAHMKGKIEWTEEVCVAAAARYGSRTAWSRGADARAYAVARKNGWLEKCCQHMESNKKPNGYWNNKKRCLESASKYSTPGEWHQAAGGARGAALKNGWYEECCKHMKAK